MKPPQFHFIHKSSQSGSLSHGDMREKRQIYRHVQLGRRNKNQNLPTPSQGLFGSFHVLPEEHQISTSAYQGPLATNGAASGNTERTMLSNNHKNRHSSTPVQTSLRRATKIKEKNRKSTSNGKSTVSRHQSRQPRKVGKVLPISRRPEITGALIDGNSTDPFGATAAPLNEHTFLLLQYYKHIRNPRTWSPNWFKGAPSARIERTEMPHSMMVQSCFNNEMMMLALLANMASMKEYLEISSHHVNSRVLIGKATIALQKYIETSSRIDDSLLSAIVLVAWAEYYHSNMEAATIHMKAMKDFIAHLGGMAALPLHLRWWVISAEEVVMAEPLSSKPLYLLEDNGSDWTGSRSVSNPVSQVGPPEVLRAQDRQIAGLPEALAPALGDLQESLAQMEHCFSSQNNDNTGEYIRSKRRMHTQLWVIRLGIVYLDVHEPMAAATRLAVLVWLYMLERRTKRMFDYATRLRVLLNSTERRVWVNEIQLYRWILLTGAIGSECNVDEMKWFTEEFIEANPYHALMILQGFLREQDVADMLRCVLYLEAVQGSKLSGLLGHLTEAARKADG